ncbi:flippase [Methanolobus sp. WCC5]|uniref:flippase n=1 Tax=Methanolobus sp. WCC5 TaxID=3125785 RepID=UPI003248D14A
MNIGAVQRQSIILFIWQIAYTFIGFLSTIYFARTVGASVLGGYFLFVAYFTVISLVTDGGFGGAAVKRISEGKEQNEYFSAFVVLRSLFVILVIVILLISRRYFVDFNDAGTFMWFLLALAVSVMFGAISGAMQGCGKVGVQATGNFVNNISRIIVQVIAVFFGFGTAGLAGGFVFGMLVGTLLQLHFFGLSFVSFEWKHIKNLATFSAWIFLISSGVIVFSTSDTIMIGYYLNNSDVGVYRIALQLSAMAGFTAIALRSTLWPRVSRWSKIGETGLIEESISRAFTYSIILAVPMFAGGILLGDKILYFFYGEEFAGGYISMIVLLIVQIVTIIYYLFSAYLTALDNLKDLSKVTMIAVAINIALNAALIPLVGIAGAAIATLLTMGLNAILASRLLSKILTIRIEYGCLMNILKASIMMSLFIGMYRLMIPISNVWQVIIPIILGGGIYAVLVLKYDGKIYEEIKSVITGIRSK